MAWFGPFDTGSTYWKLKYNAYEHGAGNVRFDIYFWHNGQSGFYYTNAKWTFTCTVGNTSKTINYSGTKTGSYPSDLYVTTIDVPFGPANVGYHYDAFNTSISASFTNTNSVSPYYGSGSGTLTVSANSGRAGVPTITSAVDNGNNTFTVVTTMGSNGWNNAVSNVRIYYSYTNSNPTTSTGTANGSGAISGRTVTFNIPFPSNASIVYIRAYSISALSDNPGGSVASHSLTYYTNPGAPGTPVLNYTGAKPTLRQTLTFSWPAASPGSASSPIAGYRFVLYKNNDQLIDLNLNNAKFYYDTESTSTSWEITSAIKAQLTSGDIIKLGIYSYAKNGAGNQLFNGGGQASAQVYSATYLLGNSGLMRIKVNGTWKEGQVFVKVNGVWKEATGVFLKANGNWNESI